MKEVSLNLRALSQSKKKMLRLLQKLEYEG